MVSIENLYDQSAIQTIRDCLLNTQKSIAVAESVTCGLLQAAIGSAQDASMYFQGGITAYNLAQKYKHLMVEPIQAEACNCVSEEVACEMALHVCSMFGSDYGIGITGYAVPAPESGNELFAYYAVYYEGKQLLSKRLEITKANPLQVQLYYINQVLQDLKTYFKSDKREGKRSKISVE